jgi:uncharacterized membrane protein
MPRPSMIEISPKVSLPAISLAAFGLITAVVGVVIGDDTLRTVGVTAISAGVAGGFVGYAAPVGNVVVPDPEPAPDVHPDDIVEGMT